MNPLTWAIVAAFLVTTGLLYTKPKFLWNATKTCPKPWGIAADRQGNQKTLFNMYTIVALTSLTTYLIAAKWTTSRLLQ